jgi:hypothetical protein
VQAAWVGDEEAARAISMNLDTHNKYSFASMAHILHRSWQLNLSYQEVGSLFEVLASGWITGSEKSKGIVQKILDRIHGT